MPQDCASEPESEIILYDYTPVMDFETQPGYGYLNATQGERVVVLHEGNRGDEDGWIYARLKNDGTGCCARAESEGWLPTINIEVASAAMDSSALVGGNHNFVVGSLITALPTIDRPHDDGNIRIDRRETPLQVRYIGSVATGDEHWIFVETVGCVSRM